MAVNQRTMLTVQPWSPSVTPSPVSDDTLAPVQNTAVEFLRLRKIITALVNAAIQATDVAPRNPLNGMVRYATGAWGTALGAEGLYVYKTGAWTHIV